MKTIRSSAGTVSTHRPVWEKLMLVACMLTLLGQSQVRAAEVPTVPTVQYWAKLPPHPRLLATAARFESLKLQDDPTSKQLLALVKRSADSALTAKPIVYPPTGFLFDPMRTVQGRVLSLSLQYRLTGEKKYFDKAREELLAMSALPEWRPSHFLDVGEACVAAGIGLDWLYDDLSADDRDKITAAIVKNGLLPSLTVEATPNSWLRGDFNWTQVCHGGLVVAALAIAEREPELSRQIIERAVTHFDRVGATYAPDGSYAEGPGYWSYGTGFHVILIEALRSSLGTGCGLDKFPGFLKTADFSIQMVAPTGKSYNFSDAGDGNLNEDPIMLWFARERRDRNLARAELARIARAADTTPAPTTAEKKWVGTSRHLAFEALWWDPTLPAGQESRALHWTAGGSLPLGVMRSAWDDPNASFIAIKGGTPNHSHAHMDVGSFILEAGGVRWAVELGGESYNKMRQGKLDLWNYSQDSTRWTTFRAGPEGHSILRFNDARQDVSGKADITALPPENGIVGNVVDLTSIYKNQVTTVRRTAKLFPDRSMTIQDEWTAGDQDVRASFQWITRAKVTRTSTGLLLEQNGKSLALTIDPPAATIDVQDVSEPRAIQDSPNPGVTRIVITIPTAAQASSSVRVHAAVRE